MSSDQLLRLLLLLVTLLAVTLARNKAPAVDPMRYEFLAEKRDYGWNDCEFSPLSCLLRKRREAGFPGSLI